MSIRSSARFLSLTTSLWLAAGAPAAAQSTTFDTFEGPHYSVGAGYIDTVPLLRADGPSFLPGITRSLEIQPAPNTVGIVFLGVAGTEWGGLLYGGAYGAQPLSMSLSYGLDASMNHDLSGSSAFQLLFHKSPPLKLTVYAYTDAPDPADNPWVSTLTVDIGATYQSVMTLPMAAFTPADALGRGVNWADVDRLSFAFVKPTPGSGQFSLYSIALQPVPEPASAALLLLGLPLLLARRFAGSSH